MKARDRRAMWILGLWLGGIGLFLLGKKAIAFRRDWRNTQSQVASALKLRAEVERELQMLRVERENLKGIIAKDLMNLTEDQLRLKGQAAILGVAEKAGLKGVQLRGEPFRSEFPLWELRWTLEGEGALAQWMDACQGIEASLPLMGLKGLHLEGLGDPWGMGNSSLGSEGPSIKGRVLCSWILLTDSVEPPPSSTKPLPAAPPGEGRGTRTTN